MRTIRYAAWMAIAILLFAGGVFYLANKGTDLGVASRVQVGGPFALTSHEGKRLSSEDLKGQPFAIFFGFTYCPDICPTTLAELSQTIEALGDDAGKMQYLFVTVDPERDTPEVLSSYVSSFDNRIVGLTGTQEEIAEIASAYRVYYEKVPTENDYTMNHSSLIYLMDKNGQFVNVVGYGVDADKRLEAFRRLIARS